MMKTTIRKANLNKVSNQDTIANIKPTESNKAKKTRLLDLDKSKIFNRFIEASCDCV